MLHPAPSAAPAGLASAPSAAPGGLASAPSAAPGGLEPAPPAAPVGLEPAPSAAPSGSKRARADTLTEPAAAPIVGLQLLFSRGEDSNNVAPLILVPAVETGTALQKAALGLYKARTMSLKYHVDDKDGAYPGDDLFPLWSKVNKEEDEAEYDGDNDTPLVSKVAYTITGPVVELDLDLYLQCVKASNNDKRAEANVFHAPEETAWVVTITIDCLQ